MEGEAMNKEQKKGGKEKGENKEKEQWKGRDTRREGGGQS